jgi:hypothetical protein
VEVNTSCSYHNINRYYPSRQGQGVDQNPSWPAISQNQSFPGSWSQMPQLTATTSQVILEFHHQPLLVMLEIGRQPLQAMLKTNNQPLQVMLGAQL